MIHSPVLMFLIFNFFFTGILQSHQIIPENPLFPHWGTPGMPEFVQRQHAEQTAAALAEEGWITTGSVMPRLLEREIGPRRSCRHPNVQFVPAAPADDWTNCQRDGQGKKKKKGPRESCLWVVSIVWKMQKGRRGTSSHLQVCHRDVQTVTLMGQKGLPCVCEAVCVSLCVCLSAVELFEPSLTFIALPGIIIRN